MWKLGFGSAVYRDNGEDDNLFPLGRLYILNEVNVLMSVSPRTGL